MSVEYQAVLTDRREGILTLTLNRPESYNALNAVVKHELMDALKNAVRDNSVRCVVLTGSGTAFSSGQDLKEPALTSATSISDSVRKEYNPVARLLYTMEKPVIASINGVAAGAGLSLALACDLRIMASNASLRVAFSNIGLAPDCGASFTLPQLVGRSVALEMAYTGRAVGADEALRRGLVNQVVTEDSLRQATAELAETLAARPTRALGLTKHAVNRALTVDFEEALEYEALTQEIASGTDDFLEGITAFREKRQPHFEGR
ncbi:MAG: 2-(1,2-epoxy,2-dihydrophenyl)acetyl-CoA isomerase [Chloroflexi bacterium]|nr:2-(1,2-epoxy,2-dihydrophenyl)acetyl-CoA isomerase [Chloroflexota bacterium]